MQFKGILIGFVQLITLVSAMTLIGMLVEIAKLKLELIGADTKAKIEAISKEAK